MKWKMAKFRGKRQPYIIYEDGTVVSLKISSRKSTENLRDHVDNKLIKEHRLIAATFCENLFPNSWDVVHHIDLNTNNNKVNNLIWMSKGDHTRFHNKLRMEWPEVTSRKEVKKILDHLWRTRPEVFNVRLST